MAFGLPDYLREELKGILRPGVREGGYKDTSCSRTSLSCFDCDQVLWHNQTEHADSKDGVSPVRLLGLWYALSKCKWMNAVTERQISPPIGWALARALPLTSQVIWGKSYNVLSEKWGVELDVLWSPLQLQPAANCCFNLEKNCLNILGELNDP